RVADRLVPDLPDAPVPIDLAMDPEVSLVGDWAYAVADGLAVVLSAVEPDARAGDVFDLASLGHIGPPLSRRSPRPDQAAAAPVSGPRQDARQDPLTPLRLRQNVGRELVVVLPGDRVCIARGEAGRAGRGMVRFEGDLPAEGASLEIRLAVPEHDHRAVDD